MKKYNICLLFGVCLLTPTPSFASNDIEYSFNTWITQGQTKWRHDASASNSDYGTPTSELDYQGIDSQVLEVGALSHLSTGHSLRFAVGTGLISGGTLVDDDYLSASGAAYYNATQSGAHRFSRTHSDIDGNGLFYLKGEFLPKDFQISNSLLQLNLGFGFHYWSEEYTATGVRQVECTTLTHPDLSCNPAGTVSYTGVRVITNKVEWTGFGITMDGLFPLSDKLGVKFDATYYPLMSLVNEDIHHLRTTGSSALAQDPSIRMTGNGTGYDLEATLQYRFSPKAAAHLGYRVWDRWVKDQTITFFGASGGASSATLMDFRTHRDGFIAGFDFQFD